MITDESANDMRIIAPVACLEALAGAQYKRVLQAYFGCALDFRYAIARSTL
ncbi:MAG: hypothetical protein ACU84Q_13165 [Gammaproteobacteria bacterium]